MDIAGVSLPGGGRPSFRCWAQTPRPRPSPPSRSSTGLSLSIYLSVCLSIYLHHLSLLSPSVPLCLRLSLFLSPLSTLLSPLSTLRNPPLPFVSRVVMIGKGLGLHFVLQFSVSLYSLGLFLPPPSLSLSLSPSLPLTLFLSLSFSPPSLARARFKGLCRYKSYILYISTYLMIYTSRTRRCVGLLPRWWTRVR
jgi:hypothetical protein